MPSLLTHYLFAEDFISKRDDGFLKNNEKCFKLGSQGPDILFFYGFSLTRGFHPFLAIKHYGGQIHKSDGSKFFDLLLKEASHIENEEERNVFLAFSYGHYAHYLLDSTAHPFIYYFSGFDDDGKLTGHYHYDHTTFEAYVDITLAGRREKYAHLCTKPFEVLDIEEEKLKIISKHFNNVLSTMFETEMTKDVYYNSVHNMIWFYKTLNKGGEWRRPFLGKGRVGALRLPRTRHDSILNEEHVEWKNPASGEIHNESFVDLYDQALEKLVKAYDDLSSKFNIKFEEFENEFNINYRGIKITDTLKYKDKDQKFYRSCLEK